MGIQSFPKVLKWNSVAGVTLLVGLLGNSMFSAPLQAQSQSPEALPSQRAEASRYHMNQMPARAAAYYGGTWGVDSFSVKTVESGELVKFSYRVVDADKAKVINDKKQEAFLESGHVRLVIPSLEKVGQLRQSSTPVQGMSYWMAFSNPGRPVKKGDRVNIVIGQFHANGLLVE